MFMIPKNSVEKLFLRDNTTAVYQKRKNAVLEILTRNPSQSSICLTEFIDVGNGYQGCFYKSAVGRIIHRLDLSRIRDSFYINILFAYKVKNPNFFQDEKLFEEVIESLRLDCTKENLTKRENLQNKLIGDTLLWMFEHLHHDLTYARRFSNRDRPRSSFLDDVENQFYDIHVIDCVFRCIEDEVTGWNFSFEELKSFLISAISENRNI